MARGSKTCAIYSGKHLIGFAGGISRALQMGSVSAALNPFTAVVIHQNGKPFCCVPHSLAFLEPPPRDFRAPMDDNDD